MSGIVYIEENGGIRRSEPDPSLREFYRDHILVRAFGDVFGRAPAQEERLLTLPGTQLYSSCGAYWSDYLDQRIYSDGLNGCWRPDPQGAAPEYAGVRFDRPVRVTGFQFASAVHYPEDCPESAGPCACPATFSLDASNDGASWTTLLLVENSADMAIAFESPFPGEDPYLLEDGTVFLSGRLEVPNQGWFLFYRMNVQDFTPNLAGGYNVSEMIFYGFA